MATYAIQGYVHNPAPAQGGALVNLPFTPSWHAPQFSPGVYVVNDYTSDYIEQGYSLQEPPTRRRFGTDPFVRRHLQAGPHWRERVWLHGLAGPANPNDAIFCDTLRAGFCAGLAATVGNAYERLRHGMPDVMINHQPLEAVLDSALRAQLQVLTADVLLHCKWFLIRAQREVVDWLVKASDPHLFRPLVLFVPMLELDVGRMKQRLVHAHAVFLHQMAVGPGGVRARVWDSNLPDQAGREVVFDSAGNFSYQTNFGRECLLTSAAVPDAYEHVQGGSPTPVRLGNFRAVPLPLGLFFPPTPRPMANAFNLIFG